MKGVIRGIIVILFGLAVHKVCVTVHNALSELPIVTQYSIDFDVRFSANAKQKITQFIQQHHLFNTFNYEQQCALLKQEFPCISDCSCYKHPNGICYVSVYAIDSCAVVNNTQIISDAGSCLNSSWVDGTYLSMLPELVVVGYFQDAEKIEPSCKEFINRVAWHEYKDYRVEWHSAIKHRLINKKQPLFSLIGNNEHIPSSALIKACDNIMQELEAKGHFKHKKEWVADVRFEGQVVVYMQGKGG